MKTIEERVEALEKSLIALGLNTKKVLTFDEAAQFTGLSKSYLYKMTSQRLIPVSRPTGKLLFFNREELETWLLKNRVSTMDEIEQKAQAYCLNKKMRNG